MHEPSTVRNSVFFFFYYFHSDYYCFALFNHSISSHNPGYWMELKWSELNLSQTRPWPCWRLRSFWSSLVMFVSILGHCWYVRKISVMSERESSGTKDGHLHYMTYRLCCSFRISVSITAVAMLTSFKLDFVSRPVAAQFFSYWISSRKREREREVRCSPSSVAQSVASHETRRRMRVLLVLLHDKERIAAYNVSTMKDDVLVRIEPFESPFRPCR